MKMLLEKHVLFPKRVGIIPYYWLIFLAPILSSLPSMTVNKQIITLVLLAIFLKAYREGYETSRWTLGYIVLQLVISVVYQFMGMTGLMIFTAWQIGFLTIHRGLFYRYLAIYYFFSLFSIVNTSLWMMHADANNVAQLLIVILFAIFSPIVARSINESIYRTKQINRENKRLEALIRKGERDRIARDLHDNLGQSFSMITLKAELAQRLLVKQPDKVGTELVEIAQISRNNLQLVRQIVSGLENRSIAKLLLEEESYLTTAKIYLNTEGEELAENWPIDVQNTFSSCIKEAFTNVVRHSRAQSVNCLFSQTEHYFQVSVHDDGVGWSKISDDSHGIKGIEARLMEKNGLLQLSEDKGVKLIFKIPFREEENE